jgi:hypothetical protein
MTFSDLNPKFVYFSPLRSTPADARALAEHVDHAIIALDGRAPLGGDVVLEPLAPVDPAESALRIELWVNALDDYTCTYGFLCSSENGRVPHARGERSVVSIDPVTKTAHPWEASFRAVHQELLKDLPAYA